MIYLYNRNLPGLFIVSDQCTLVPRYSFDSGVFKIRPEPTRFIKVPLIKKLTSGGGAALPEDYTYIVSEGEPVFPGTFALDTREADILDYSGFLHFSIWIIEPRQMFIDNDNVIVQMTDGRIFAGVAKILTDRELIIRNHEGMNCEVLDFNKIRFIGRLVKGINVL